MTTTLLEKTKQFNAIECSFVNKGGGHISYIIKGILENPIDLLHQRATEIRMDFPGAQISKKTDSFVIIELPNGNKVSLTLFEN